MNFESFKKPKQETGSITPEQKREKIVEAFQLNKEEGLRLYSEWITSQEARRDKNEITEIDLFWEQAQLLRDCGLYKEAIDSFDQVGEQAWQEGKKELNEKCNQEIDKLINLINNQTQ